MKRHDGIYKDCAAKSVDLNSYLVQLTTVSLDIVAKKTSVMLPLK